MSYHNYWSYESQEAYKQGHHDEHYGRSSYDYDKYSNREKDKAYFEGRKDERREEENRREDREQEEREQERQHQAKIEEQQRVYEEWRIEEEEAYCAQQEGLDREQKKETPPEVSPESQEKGKP